MTDQKKKPRTVADELHRRQDCRYGLRGVRVTIADEGPPIPYVVDGSDWDAREQLRLVLVPESRWAEYAASKPHGFITSAQLDAWRPPSFMRIDIAADRCILVSDWPEVCRCWQTD